MNERDTEDSGHGAEPRTVTAPPAAVGGGSEGRWQGVGPSDAAGAAFDASGWQSCRSAPPALEAWQYEALCVGQSLDDQERAPGAASAALADSPDQASSVQHVDDGGDGAAVEPATSPTRDAGLSPRREIVETAPPPVAAVPGPERHDTDIAPGPGTEKGGVEEQPAAERDRAGGPSPGDAAVIRLPLAEEAAAAAVPDAMPAAAAVRSAATPVEPPFVAAAPAAEQAPARRTRLPPWRDLVRKSAWAVAYAVAGYMAVVLMLIGIFRFVDPPGSMLMLLRAASGVEIKHVWVPIERISPHLVRATVVSEDGRFCDHWGIDLAAIESAIERAGSGTPRGASTISMQVVKNMFLWPSKSYVRKAIELPLTLAMELVWPKRRILEVYLNVAEWGPGVFGAEAAAQHHFRKSAASLGERESAQLAAALPNPFRRKAGEPGPRTAQKASVIQARVRAAGWGIAHCVLARRPETAPQPKAPLGTGAAPGM